MNKIIAALAALAISLAPVAPAFAGFSDQATYSTTTSGGTSNAQTVALPNVNSMSDLLGVVVRFIAGHSNTGATTIAVGGMTATTVKQISSTGLVPLTGGEIVATNPVQVMFDGAEFIILNVPSAAQTNPTFYGASSGSANALVATMTPALTSYQPGSVFVVKANNFNTGPVTVQLSGLGVVNLLQGNGSPILFHQIAINQELVMTYDGVEMQLVSAPSTPTVLQSNVIYYVSPTGNDSNNGLSSGTAWLTLQHAANEVAGLNINGFTIEVVVADGSYAQFVVPTLVGGGAVYFVGDTISPGNVIVTNAAGSAIIDYSAQSSFQGFTLISSAANLGAGDPGVGFYCNGCHTIIGQMKFGTAQGAHIYVTGGGATLYIGGSITLSGSLTPNAFLPGAFVFAGPGTVIAMTNGTLPFLAGFPWTNFNLTIQSAVSVPFFMYASGGLIGMQYNSITNPGNVTGQRYLATLNGVINTNGGGAAYWPGTIGGSVSMGGQYN